VIVMATTRCPQCGDLKQFPLHDFKIRRWKQEGEPIQRVFPELSTEDRERLISGTCPKCWDSMFPEETF
jgi:hypothetical protein